MSTLLFVAKHGGDPLLARIGMMKALYPDAPKPMRRRRVVKAYRIVS
jgi:hypothetical protein